jgi:hypothetical protein
MRLKLLCARPEKVIHFGDGAGWRYRVMPYKLGMVEKPEVEGLFEDAEFGAGVLGGHSRGDKG